MTIQIPHTVLDPDGDLLVILRNPSSIFDDHEEPDIREMGDRAPKRCKSTATSTDSSTPEEDTIADSDRNHESYDYIDPDSDRVFKCSSKHLSLTAPGYKKMLVGPWHEATKLDSDGMRRWVIEGFDKEAMTIVLSVIHHQYIRVPDETSLERLVEIARVVDYVGCGQVLQYHASKFWIPHLRSSIPKTFNVELIFWICISGVFKDEKIFQDCTYTAIVKSHSGIPCLGLPILPQISTVIEHRKIECLDAVFTNTFGLLHELTTTDMHQVPLVSGGDVVFNVYTFQEMTVKYNAESGQSSPHPPDEHWQFRTSSDKLAWASPFFKWLFERWQEREASHIRPWHYFFEEPGFGLRAIREFLETAHGYPIPPIVAAHPIPIQVIETKLSRLALVAVWFKCHGLLCPSARAWISYACNNLLLSHGPLYPQKCNTWILISIVFREPHLFRHFTCYSMIHHVNSFAFGEVPVMKIAHGKSPAHCPLQSVKMKRLTHIL
ncbi:hypothetical protein F4808DRAFT_466782 [Astrocystis sublimbata]|nr:hypothetical protein F4808DRAFT_466782 [Astrocystis sublimbata]